MINLTFILLGIILLFVVFLFLRSVLSLRVCALCAATAITWITLLLMSYFGSVVDPLILGILMGGSAVGVMYLLEEKLPENYSLFKLPFFLTLISLIYLILGNNPLYLDVIILVIIWILFSVIFIFKNKSLGFKRLSKKIIECCKNW